MKGPNVFLMALLLVVVLVGMAALRKEARSPEPGARTTDAESSAEAAPSKSQRPGRTTAPPANPAGTLQGLLRDSPVSGYTFADIENLVGHLSD